MSFCSTQTDGHTFTPLPSYLQYLILENIHKKSYKKKTYRKTSKKTYRKTSKKTYTEKCVMFQILTEKMTIKPIKKSPSKKPTSNAHLIGAVDGRRPLRGVGKQVDDGICRRGGGGHHFWGRLQSGRREEGVVLSGIRLKYM